jgi:hypothetical protein
MISRLRTCVEIQGYFVHRESHGDDLMNKSINLIRVSQLLPSLSMRIANGSAWCPGFRANLNSCYRLAQIYKLTFQTSLEEPSVEMHFFLQALVLDHRSG